MYLTELCSALSLPEYLPPRETPHERFVAVHEKCSGPVQPQQPASGLAVLIQDDIAVYA